MNGYTKLARIRSEGTCVSIGYDEDLWFPENGQNGNRAKKVCDGCPVKALCSEYAREEGIYEGIWGGESPRERGRYWAVNGGRPTGFQEDLDSLTDKLWSKQPLPDPEEIDFYIDPELDLTIENHGRSTITNMNVVNVIESMIDQGFELGQIAQRLGIVEKTVQKYKRRYIDGTVNGEQI